MREISRRQNDVVAGDFRADCARIFREWHERARALDTQGLLALYSEDAVLESPLVPAILDDKQDGYCVAMTNCADFSTKADGGAPMNSCDGAGPASG
jgi:hypothetical protein